MFSIKKTSTVVGTVDLIREHFDGTTEVVAVFADRRLAEQVRDFLNASAGVALA